MGTYRQPSLVLDKSFGQINEAMAEFNKNLIAKINADKKQALANEKAKNKLLREQEKQNARYRDYGRDIEKKLSVLKIFKVVVIVAAPKKFLVAESVIL